MTGIPKECSKYKCKEPHFKMGKCEKHYNNEVTEKIREDAAVNTLHSGLIDGEVPRDRELNIELQKIKVWWNRTCDSLNHNRIDNVLLDEAEFATSWCISFTKEIIDAELALRNNKSIGHKLHSTREWVWERFNNLEAGLNSNGTKRNTS